MPLADICVAGATSFPGEWDTLSFDQGIGGTVATILKDAAGNAVVFEEGDTVEFYAVEMPGDRTAAFTGDVTIPEDGEDGEVRVQISALALKWPGVWLGGFLVKDSEGVTKSRHRIYLEVVGDLLGTSDSYNRPISIAEVRLVMRDRFAADNVLLDALAFSTTEIAYCIRWAIDDWHDTLPCDTRYTPSSFPFRTPWMNAVLAELYSIMAHSVARNDFKYQAAGVAVSDVPPVDLLLKKSQDHRDMWEAWKHRMKMKQAHEAGFFSGGGMVAFDGGSPLY